MVNKSCLKCLQVVYANSSKYQGEIMNVFIFPGQGSQYGSMAKKLFDKYNLAKDLYSQARNIIGNQLVDASFEADEQLLMQTSYSQPAIFLYSFILFSSLIDENKIKVSDKDFYAGHSLGEITALAASKAMSFSDALKFVRFRGEAMASVSVENGMMAALLKPDIDGCQKVFSEEFNGSLYIANLNSPSQISVSGLKDAFDSFNNKYQKQLFLKAIPLKVSAPFHCPFMEDAAKLVAKELEKYTFNLENVVKVISNKTAQPYPANIDGVRKNISDAIINQVNWIDSVKYLKSNNFNSYIEIGPRSILIPFVKEIDSEAMTQSFID